MENSLDVVEAHLKNFRDISNLLYTDISLRQKINRIAGLCVGALKSGNKIIFAGNGGSAAEAQHMAAEYVSRFGFDRNALPGLALTTDTSILTAIGNDYGYEHVFSRQLTAIAKSGDVFFGYSTSGTSKNILEAIDVCKSMGVVTVLVTGEKFKNALPHTSADYILMAPSLETARVQECHTVFGHLICGITELVYFGKIQWKQ